MKDIFLKLAKVKDEKSFYKLYPTEEDFLKVHSKALKKALLGDKIRKAQAGVNQEQFNQMGAGANTQADVQSAISNISVAAPKKTTGNVIADATKSIPILGKLVGGITGLFDAAAERKRQVRAGALSDLQLKASQSAPRQENRKYNRPDLDGNIDDINSLMPAEGTGTNLLGRDGIILRGGGEIANTYAPNTIYSDMGYEPLSESERIKNYFYGGNVPQAQLGGLVGSILGGASKSGGGGSGILGGALSGILGGGGGDKSTTETTTLDPSKQVMNNNIAQASQATATGLSAIPGMNTKMAQSSKSIGEAVGSAIPGPIGAIASPVLGAVAQGIGAIAENKSGKKAMDRIQRNNAQMASAQASKLMQGQQSSFMRHGGQLRENSSELEQKGELNTLWGGHAEPISYNPYLGEETIMFRGNSHEESDGKGRTGIGVKYGEGGDLQPYDANVEVERGEPAVQIADENGEKNLVVFGNLPIPNQFVSLLGDPKAKGKKFKNYVALLSKDEEKQNKIMEKASSELSALNPQSPFEKIKFDSLSAMMRGADAKLKDFADKKQKAADLQEAINKEAEERGVDAEALSKGKIKALKGITLQKAQDGFIIEDDENAAKKRYEERKSNTPTKQNTRKLQAYPTPDKNYGDLPKISKENYDILKGLYDKALKTKDKNDILTFQKTYHKLAPEYAKRINQDYPLTKHGTDASIEDKVLANEDGMMEDRTMQYMPALGRPDDSIRMTPLPPDLSQKIPPREIKPLSPQETPEESNTPPQFFNPIGNYLPSNREDLDPRQLTGEYFALATNQLEPVPAQQYHPTLRTPYEISLQDILNENTAATRGAQRFMGYNPAAQANLLAQQYGANAKVLGDQFRINQEAKDKIYDRNVDILNDAQLKNLGILDKQYERQAMAKSKTKDVAREALSSISDKYLQNQLQNRTLATYENLYNYRYDQNQHAWNMNGPAQWNMQGSGNEPTGWESLSPAEKQLAVEEAQQRKARKEVSAEGKSKRNGAILKAMRNL